MNEYAEIVWHYLSEDEQNALPINDLITYLEITANWYKPEKRFSVLKRITNKNYLIPDYMNQSELNDYLNELIIKEYYETQNEIIEDQLISLYHKTHKQASPPLFKKGEDRKNQKLINELTLDEILI